MGKTTTKVDTKTKQNPDGSITKTVTTTTTEYHDNGTTSTKTKVELFTENIPTGGGKGKGGGGGAGAGATTAKEAQEQMKNAERVPNTTDRKFIQECLEEHNRLRKIHGVGPMTLDEDLNKVAQAWANRIAKKGQMAHSTFGFGENVFWASGGTLNGAKAVQAWYSEIKDFNFRRIDHTPGTGHFTQMVWKASDKLGVAMATGKAGHMVVCEYNPPGNFLGQYTQNIFPPRG